MVTKNKQNKKTLWNDIYDKSKDYDFQDSLGFTNAKNAFVKVIQNARTPMTIGLYGKWGSGKTWMIEGIRQGLESQGVLTVAFDAWKYRREKNLVLPLMCKLEREIYSQSSDQKQKNKRNSGLKLWWQKRQQEDFPLLGTLGLVLANQFICSTAKIDLYKAEQEARKKVLKQYQQYADNIENIEDEYTSFIKSCLKIVNKNGSNEQVKIERVVIFIDNLDRCLPDTVVTLLEDISSFLSFQAAHCVYVLAMDKDNVIKAIKHRYPDFDGVHYLEKIVQLNIKMPEITHDGEAKWISHFIIRCNRAKMSKDTCFFGYINDVVLTELEKIKGIFSPGGILNNPRRIEKVVNRLFTIEAMEDRDKINPQASALSVYLLGLLLNEYFPSIYNVLTDKKDIVYLQQVITWTREGKSQPHDRKNSTSEQTI